MAELLERNAYNASYSETFTNTLDAIALATDPTDTNELADIIVGAINTAYFGGGLTTAQLAEFKTLPFFALGAYMAGDDNANLNAYNMVQRDYINLLTKSIYNIPVETLPTRIYDVQDNVMKSGLSPAEQGPLLFAVMIGINAFDYWKAKVATPGDWETLLEENAPYQPSQYALIPQWVGSAMEGALYGANMAANNHTEGYADNPGISKWAITALITAIKQLRHLKPRSYGMRM